MSPTVTLRGEIHFSWKKLISGGKMGESTFTGPGEVLLAPSVLGDIMVLPMYEGTWKVSRDCFLAHTTGIKHTYIAQGITKAMFSGAGLFVYNMTGTGLLWMQSFGAIIKKEVRLWIFVVLGWMLTLTFSWRKERSTMSITGILLPGTVIMCLNVLLLAESSPHTRLLRVLLASSRVQVRFTYRPEI